MSEEIINILPENISNKIAAGEVVQRPASVLKELIENSIDAEAKSIEVIIKNAGKTLIQVVDDGLGMSQKDAVKCIQRHATSKIRTVEDLSAIRTFGFRGEALSSIASVSLTEIRTEMYDDELGTLIRYEEDKGIVVEKGSFAKGTSVIVKNLFYNTPARRNFLKSNSTELRHLIDTFKVFSLSHPSISFSFWNDDDEIFNYPAADLEERIKSVIADNIFDAIIPFTEKTDLLDIVGFVAKPTFLKKSRGDQYLFINKRYVQSKIVNHAVFSAFENILEKGDYPFFILFLSIDLAKVDVNVHPSKLEVKFEDEKIVYSFVNAAVKKAIGKYDLVPNLSFNPTKDSEDSLIYTNYRRTGEKDFSDRPAWGGNKPVGSKNGIFTNEEIDNLFDMLNTDLRKNSTAQEIASPFENQFQTEVQHLNQKGSSESSASEESTFIISLHNKYILAQIKSGLMIIDQHVAHERILYEKVLRSFEADMPFSQQLLFSQTIQVDPADYDLLREIETYLQKLGYDLRFFGKGSIVIHGVPSDIKIGHEVETLLQVLLEFRTNRIEKKLEVKDNLAKSFSCKAAIKAGDRLSEQEMRMLVDQLFATSMPYVCPHGRPIVVKISLDELDKRFGRT